MKKFSIFALAAIFFAACTTDHTVDVQPCDAPETLTVSFEEDTRIQLNENQKTVWTEGDFVSVFYRSNANQKWQYQGETGARKGDLKRISAGSATETMPRVVVVYPYNDSYYINTETYNVEATLPAMQHYLKDSYGLDGNLMISSGEYNQFSLKNVCGWLKLQLTGNGEVVKSITLKGNNGEQVAGQIYINSADATATLASEMGAADDNENSAGGNLVFEDTIIKEVTLDCGEGVTLGSEATAFYIALPPQMFEKGITVEIADTSGYKMTQSTDKSLAIERNTIQPMAALAFEEKIAANQIHYTSSDGKIVTPNKADAFGVSIKSNVYENGKGVITFDGNVTSIGYRAFFKCSSLTSITIPDSVTEIGEGAFCWCDGLTSVIIPDNVTEIGDSAFRWCSSLISVTIPDSVTEIGEGAFCGCMRLTSITIPNSVTSIGEEAFYCCSSLTAFYGKFASDDNRCLVVNGELTSFAPSGLTEYTIPNSVTLIGSYAFRSCALTSVTIGNSVTEIGDYAFCECGCLRSVTIGNSVTSIGEGAFCGCNVLASVTIPDSVTSIGDYAFYVCSSLTSVTIPNSVTSIGDEAFYGCSSLTSITIPNSVTSIGSYAFYDCSSLKTVYCKPTTPPTGDISMFSSNAFGRIIYVPASEDDSIINAYKAKQYWSDYKSYIYEYDFSAEQ